MTSTNTPLVLVDGSSYFYRAFHALPPLTNSKGMPTGAIYGVINMIRKLIKDNPDAIVAIVFDAKGKTFRDELYPEYKSTREKMPDDLRAQQPMLHEVVQAMGLPLIVIEGVEADDVIGTYAKQAEASKRPVKISTGDKDMAQLVNEHITCINTMTNHVMDIPGVEEKFGVPPELIIDYLSLVGDKSDNVPGVDKVGPKTAVKWLKEYGSLDEVMAQVDTVKGKVGENLRVALDHLPLSRQLVTIKTDCDLPLTIDELKTQAADKARLIELFRDLEFKSWLNELLNEQPEDKLNFNMLMTSKQFDKFIAELSKLDSFTFDTETTSLSSIDAELVGLSFAGESLTPTYIPLTHDYEGAPKQLDRDTVLAALKPIFANPHITKIAQNLKYDMSVLAKYDIDICGPLYDTMLESYTLNSAGNRHDMDTLALKYLGRNTISFEDVAGKGAKQKTFNQIALNTAAEYAAEDADVTQQLHEKMWPLITAEEKVASAYQRIEMPLVPVLSRMERNGVLIDKDCLAKQSQMLATRIEEIVAKTYEIVGEEFNLSSPKQLQAILFEKMQIPVTQKTATGQPSTAESVLQELAHDYELPQLILEYRGLAKLKSTYTDALPQQIKASTGRVHTHYNQAVTSTGRLSSTEPNLQNIPVRTEQGRAIRKAFIAPAGRKIISADYSQIELRIMSHLSQDAGLTQAFIQGHDIHAATASEVFNVALDQVSAEQRRNAKAINFGLIYGMSAFGLAKQLGCTREEAQAYIDLYFSRYPGVQNYIEQTRALAHEKGYVETHYGRRIHLAEINARNFQRQKAAERAAINAPLQGTAADIIKLAMIDIDAWLQQDNVPALMIMQVHDELVFEVDAAVVDDFSRTLEEKMCHVTDMDVNFEVAVGVGDNWDEAH